jgi:hypothetical protein
MTMQATGSCLCGTVKYIVTADFEMSGNCHCNTCRKITGSAFEAFAIIDRANFTCLEGEAAQVQYKISPKAKKHFCGTCGTPVFNQLRLAPGKLIVHVGTLDDPTRVAPAFNLYCESMLPWVAEISSLKSFDQGFNS